MQARPDDVSTPDAAALYFGEVMHARIKPIGHRFNYRVMSLLIDLGRLEAADRQSAFFGVNRAALYSFHEADHGERDGGSLLAYAQRRASEHGIDLRGGRVQLLCYPRLFGYSFNPLSVYFCHNANGELALLIYEVRNTFGEMHAYVLPVGPEQVSAAGIRQQQEKLFYVSPFVEMAMRYHFRVSPPGGDVRLRILETDDEGPLLSASFYGRRRPLTSAALMRSAVALPFLTFKIVAAIHWQALLLWLKGIRLVPRPEAADTKGHATALARDESPAYTGDALTPRGSALWSGGSRH